mmetsp:Transcript_10091/g.28175  ORF Transcript_10091/g.28175 Transcript_10091/m.28175 type:complete len:268 (+) Transcript_10091:402-1205(+)
MVLELNGKCRGVSLRALRDLFGEVPLEGGMVPQQAGLSKVHERPKITEFVLQRGARQQKAGLGLKLAQGLAGAGGWVFDLMGLVDNNRVPRQVEVLRCWVWCRRRPVLLGLARAVVVAGSAGVALALPGPRLGCSNTCQTSCTQEVNGGPDEVVGHEEHTTSGNHFLQCRSALLHRSRHNVSGKPSLLGPLVQLPSPLLQQSHRRDDKESRALSGELQAGHEGGSLNGLPKTHLIGQHTAKALPIQVPHPSDALSLVVVEPVVHGAG